MRNPIRNPIGISEEFSTRQYLKINHLMLFKEFLTKIFNFW